MSGSPNFEANRTSSTLHALILAIAMEIKRDHHRENPFQEVSILRDEVNRKRPFFEIKRFKSFQDISSKFRKSVMPLLV